VSSTADGSLVVYTCITRGYDDLRRVEREPEVSYVCFTDHAPADSLGWEIRPLPRQFSSGVLANRWVKMHPHLLFPEQECSVYVDGNVVPKCGVAQLAKRALRDHAFAMYSHPVRDCIYDEAVECAMIGHDWLWAFARQLRKYRNEGFPAHWGLYECNILLRRHHSAAIAGLMESWWQELQRGVHRDQISLPYLLWKAGVPVHALGKSHIRSGSPIFGFQVQHNAVPWRKTMRRCVNAAALSLVRLPQAATQ
jgi:hypothetical protein